MGLPAVPSVRFVASAATERDVNSVGIRAHLVCGPIVSLVMSPKR